jgi:sigma-B regulation protein RsbU (phosphoserine phosphatase)
VTSPRILVVDDDEDLRTLIARALRADGSRQIEGVRSAAAAKEVLAQRDFDVVITDLAMPDEDGLSLMRWSQEKRPGASWIVLTGHGSLDAAILALQLGAFDFLTKPLPGVEPLRHAVENALAQRRLVSERDRLDTALRERVAQLEEACRLLRHQADTMQADLHRAGIIQRALLPSAAPRLSDFHVRALYRPSENVGGDLYDVVRLDDRCVALLLADAAGHGLCAAMLAVLFRSQLPLVDCDSGLPREPRDVLGAANRALCDALPSPGLFLTAAYCVLDTQTREAVIASAGHPPLLWRRQRHGIERILHTGPALGIHRDADFAQQRIDLDPGDSLLFYSDGLYERFVGDGAAGSASGRIAAAIQDDSDLEGLFETARLPETRQDDLTLLLLAAMPGVSQLDNGAPPALPPSSPEPPSAGAAIQIGDDGTRICVSIEERGDWCQSAAFETECAVAFEAGRHVMIDLALCRTLDSTFLGTIHQLCQLADRAGVEFRLQGVTPAVEALFEELGMALVMDHIVPRMLPLPTRMRPLAGEPERSARALLMLRAHEGLAALSDRNRREFDPLIAQLRREVAALTR